MSAFKVKWTTDLTPECLVEGCSERSSFGWSLAGRCAFHDMVAKARDLTPEAFDRLRATLATTPPITEDERRTLRVGSFLRTVEWTARDFKRAKRSAKGAGATEGQIADAISKGKAQA